MKLVVLVVVIAVFGAAGFWYITENDRADRELAYQRQQEQQAKIEAMEKERAERQREEDERIRKERAANVAKEDAMRMFLSYIDREEKRLKDEAEEAEINLQKIEIDQSSFEDELQAIERANEARVTSNGKRGESQRDMVERVRAMLKSVVLNRLARTYCGEDLSRMRSAFEGEMQKIKDVDDKYQKRIKGNLKKYDETVKGVDEKINKRLKSAREKYESVQKQMDPNRLAKLQKELADVERKIERILEKKMQSKWDKRDLAQLQNQQILLQNQISSVTDIAGLASGNIMHMEATEAEAEARRTFDRAGKALEMDNTAALMERDYEQDIYNRVREFENASVDKIRLAMNLTRQACEKTLHEKKKRLSLLKENSVNIDMMKAEEIEEKRKEVVKKLLEIEVEETK